MDEALRRLRDRTTITRLLIIAELQRRPGATLSDVAPGLGVTVQAVSAHAKQLAAQGWLRSDNGSYKVTAKGLQSLHEGVRHMHDAVAALASPLDVIQVTSAVAAAPVRAGEDVGLVMHDGDLAAQPGRTSPSRGIAQNAAKPGDEVVVSQLQGMVELDPGRLTLLTVPGPSEGGIRRVEVAALKRVLRSRPPPARVGAHGTGATILARRLAGEVQRPLDFEFAADRAAFNAAERGLDVLLFVSRDRLAEVIEAYDRLNADTLRRVPVEMLEAPERDA